MSGEGTVSGNTDPALEKKEGEAPPGASSGVAEGAEKVAAAGGMDPAATTPVAVEKKAEVVTFSGFNCGNAPPLPVKGSAANKFSAYGYLEPMPKVQFGNSNCDQAMQVTFDKYPAGSMVVGGQPHENELAANGLTEAHVLYHILINGKGKAILVFADKTGTPDSVVVGRLFGTKTDSDRLMQFVLGFHLVSVPWLSLDAFKAIQRSVFDVALQRKGQQKKIKMESSDSSQLGVQSSMAAPRTLDNAATAITDSSRDLRVIATDLRGIVKTLSTGGAAKHKEGVSADDVEEAVHRAVGAPTPAPSAKKGRKREPEPEAPTLYQLAETNAKRLDSQQKLLQELFDLTKDLTAQMGKMMDQPGNAAQLPRPTFIQSPVVPQIKHEHSPGWAPGGGGGLGQTYAARDGHFATIHHRYCSNCGTATIPNARACHNCGVMLQ
jgi:hypothetical protein